MNELLIRIIPNVVEYFPEMMKAIVETFQMVGVATAISAVLGVPLVLFLLVTSPGHVLENKAVNSILS